MSKSRNNDDVVLLQQLSREVFVRPGPPGSPIQLFWRRVVVVVHHRFTFIHTSWAEGLVTITLCIWWSHLQLAFSARSFLGPSHHAPLPESLNLRPNLPLPQIFSLRHRARPKGKRRKSIRFIWVMSWTVRLRHGPAHVQKPFCGQKVHEYDRPYICIPS